MLTRKILRTLQINIFYMMDSELRTSQHVVKVTGTFQED